MRKLNRRKWLLIIAAAFAYLVFVNLTRLGLPCVFRLVTGLKCPGCGTTTMCAALLRGDIHAAFHANPFLLVTLPLFFVIRQLVISGKVKDSGSGTPAFTRFFDLAYLVALLAFGILRNVPS